ncbi:regulator of G-protein signaling 9-binding protein [Sorex fumeus]|uniref:regulator of G-protein signaling 9-binding protein n=1 Tax=Sorex fumeus TaxID=62283 RepID=UPI0024AD36A8|nr:regulator of G-protein signaling 9-binding protein [Sorex fumeus]
MARAECKALLDALNRTTACYHHLVLTLGGSADSQDLREELQRTRHKAQELAATCCVGLTAALRDRSLDAQERAEFERLWVSFSGCLDLLEGDMRRALGLAAAFPLHAPRRPFVRTGVAGTTSGVAARALSARSLRHAAAAAAAAEHDFEGQDLRELERELLQVSEMIQSMEMKVNVPRWTVQARQAAGAELLSSASAGASSGGGVSVGERRRPCDLSKATAAAVFSAVLLAAVVLAVCVAKLS